MDLVTRSLAGDQRAFAALFDQYKNLVYKTAYLLQGSADDAEDTLQEVFLLVYRSLATFDPAKGAFTTWLHRITVNHCLNQRRKRRLLLLSFDKISPNLLPARDASLEQRFAEEEAVHASLNQLSEKLRAVVVLRYYSDLSHLEISQVLNIPVGTVKSRLDAAVKSLRGALNKAEGAPARTGYTQKEAPK